MKIAIIGPGAIGRLFGYTLASAGHHAVMVCRREEQAAHFLQEGLSYKNPLGVEHRVPVDATAGVQAEKLVGVDGIIVTVKSYDTETAATQLAELPTKVPVLSMQNGLGNGETLARFLAPERIAVAVTTHGAMAEGDTGVSHKGAGSTIVGGIEPTGTAANWWADLLTSCGHPAAVSENIQAEVWSKAMVNIGINPFTGLLGVKNGQLLQEPDILPLMQAAVEEAERVALSEGIILQGSFERVLDVCKKTAANESSMLTDLQKGRRTEIDALCGVIIASAEKTGQEAPYNFFLKKLVRKCETKRFELASLEMKGLFEKHFKTKFNEV